MAVVLGDESVLDGDVGPNSHAAYRVARTIGGR
jgi:hypothetical protein